MNSARASELALFYKLLGNLLAAGYSPAASLSQLVQEPSSSLQRKLRPILATLSPNASLAYYLKLPLFELDSVITNLFEKTTQTNEQVALLHALSARYSQANWANQVRGVSIYWPLLYFIIGGYALALLLQSVLPFYAEFYESMGSQLPMATASLIMFKSWAVFAFVALMAIFLVLRFRPAWLRAPIDRLRLISPFGFFFKKIALARFTHMLALLLSKNLLPWHALIMASTATENVVIGRRLQLAFASDSQVSQTHAAASSPIADTLKSCPLIPGAFVAALGIAERTKKLEETLPDLVETAAAALIRHTRTMNNLVDTVAKILVASFLAWVAFAVYLPIFLLGALT